MTSQTRSRYGAVIAEMIYALCAATSLVAAVLLFRQRRARPTRLLLWSVVGFLGLTLNNLLVWIDISLLPANNLALPRAIAGAVAMMALLYGLIRESGS